MAIGVRIDLVEDELLLRESPLKSLLQEVLLAALLLPNPLVFLV